MCVQEPPQVYPVTGMHPTPEQLEAFDRGDIAESEASTIEDHLVTCPECSARLSETSCQDELVRLVRAARQTPRGAVPPVVSLQIPGGYEVLEPIGRGGMGVVFKARQRALGRLVALKQIRAGLDADPKELIRFQTEAEAAARLAHPNIVRVFDVGQQDGFPYIAMELVEGGSLADRLRRGPFPPVGAAALLEKLARALEHAHENGVVHRDLKPANILLAIDASPRIADFGLVKFDGASMLTQSGAILGTPCYMAPEQTGLGRVGPGVDIYALGVILYECLTGRPPFQAGTPLELIEQVRTSEPVPPGKFQPGLPRDLQTICMKCLEKDPQRRFRSAGALADDLGRFLRSEPIHARPIGPGERVVKWARRRPYQAALAGLASLALTGAFAGLLVHQARLKVEIGRTAQAADYARAQKSLADANYKEARATIQAMLDCFNNPEFSTLPRRGELLRAQAEKALGFYDQLLARRKSSDPVVEIDTAHAAREAATIQYSTGKFDQAVATLERSMLLIDAVMLELPNDPGVLREQLLSRTKLAMFAWQTRKDAAHALSELRRAVADAERLVHGSPSSIEARSDLAWCLHDLGSVLIESNHNEEALSVHRRAIDINRTLSHERPEDLPRRAALAENLNNLGLVTVVTHPSLAEEAFSEAANILEGLVKANDNRRWLTSLCSVLNNLGNLARRQDKADRAFECFERGLALLDDALSREPAETTLRYNALNLHGSRANLLATLGRHSDAVKDWDKVVELNDDPADRVSYRLLRILALVRTKDYARGVTEAVAISQAQSDSGKLAAADLYNYGCFFALASVAAEGDERLDPAERRRRAQSYAATSLDWLKRAGGTGFFNDPKNREHAGTDADLRPLRNLPEFRKLLEGGSR
jgi:tetratricopeptide (TPR) repeat protein